MAAASQQASSSSLSYEVFLSFHGQDVRTSFADHLYHALVGAGVRTFRDDEELCKGKEIACNLFAAIQQSIISIPILSKNYGSSKWCLNELKEISDCKRTRNQTVLPIFYKIEPTEVRNVTGEYANAFNEHKKQFDQATMEKWQVVLQEMGKLDGWHIKEGLHEGKVVKEIVRIVSNTLNKRLMHVFDKLVGIESHIGNMLELLEIGSNDTKIVGIHGLGGVGKTTIARAVCNTILDKFEEYAFIENVREDSRRFGIQYLQKKLITAILKDGSPDIIDVDTGIKVIQRRLCTKKVLVVLDDVDHVILAKSLIGDGESFGNGSKIIITSRDKDILVSLKAKVYEPTMMSLDDSLQLFSYHAFKTDQPQEDYLDISKHMVIITGGLPLALQVIGSSLFSKKRTVWEYMLKKLKQIPNNEVMESLKISYDGLEHAEQQMFLDTACFFVGWEKDIVCHIWEGCQFHPQVGLEVLGAKSLVTINEYGELRMHDVLRDLGRDIVRQESMKPGERSRIWSKEEVLDVLIKQKGTSKCIGLTIDFMHTLNNNSFMGNSLDAMTELRLLQLDHAQILGTCCNSFSELSWLSSKGCLEQFALTNFRPEKLVVLDLSNSEVTENWRGWDGIKMAVNLKVLNLKSCKRLRSTPDFSGNPLLEVLNLRRCGNLVAIDISNCHLTNLVTLNMLDCESLVDLQTEMCELASLETLILEGCRSLEKLPDNFDCMTSLTSLRFHLCWSLQNIPNLPSSLVSLSVRECHSVQYISGLPTSLTNLEVRFCKSLVKLSSASGRGLRNLRTLNILSCISLEEIEGADDKLESLEQCHIRSCKSLKRLPKMRGSKNLASLEIHGNDLLSDFEGEGMNSLEELIIECCPLIKKIPYLKDSKRLRELYIYVCPELVEIEQFEGYESLERLYITEAMSLKTLSEEDISTLINLRGLYIWNCRSMESLPDLSNLKELNELNIMCCEKLTEIEGLYGLESLETLIIRNCNNLAEIHLVYRLKTLLQSLERLPDLSNLKKLQKLDIERCERLSKIIGLDRLESLQELKIKDCNNLAEIHGVDGLKSLMTLEVDGCCSLERLSNLSNLKELFRLWIEACDRLSEIPGLDGLESLQKLAIKRCKNLTNIHGVERMKSLRTLWIHKCCSLETLPDLSNFKNLEEVHIQGCRNIPDVELYNWLDPPVESPLLAK